jgi:hypothetical protein
MTDDACVAADCRTAFGSGAADVVMCAGVAGEPSSLMNFLPSQREM